MCVCMYCIYVYISMYVVMYVFMHASLFAICSGFTIEFSNLGTNCYDRAGQSRYPVYTSV